ncbi:histidine kinase [Tenacibaculum sp. SG-28]|uniref:sensor histidine kinase n=1 Tax=Tenacibaculum sp. SG-28 TaxID=754426 RepID=UPI000CF56293|nr:histidine kinase [Tenacibaculum sp. SG-28]PQJ23013.1 hypothetical protein BSU00_01715 [Tenacibaculum sp. SG-28]
MSGVFIVPNMHLFNIDFKEYNSNISVIENIGNDRLLFGSENGDLFLYDANKKTPIKIKLKNKEKVFSILKINTNQVLIGFSTYSIILNLSDYSYKKTNYYGNIKDFTLINANTIVIAGHDRSYVSQLNNNKERLLYNERSFAVHYSKKQNSFYIAYINGIKKFDAAFKPRDIKFKEQSIYAQDIAETSNGIVWFSTTKDGLVGVKNDEIIYHYTDQNGLLSNLTNVLKSDGDLLWVVTSKGIQVLDTVTGEFQNLTKKDGLVSYNISDIEILDNTLYFSTNTGVFVVDKRKIFKKGVVSDFSFTEILINGKKVPIQEKFEFLYGDNTIQFKFHTNGYLSSDHMQYQYQLLENEDSKSWITLDQGDSQLTFNNLASGQYDLKVRGVEIDGKNETPIKRAIIEVRLPFYKSLWFTILIFLLILMLVWYGFTKQIQDIENKQIRVLEQERIQKQLVFSKLESLQAQMNPHFIFNALNSIQNLVLKENKFSAYNYLTKFSLFIRENLNMSRKSFVDFQEELDLIYKYLELENLRFGDEFSYVINVQDEVHNIKIPTMIIQPFIENAIKHGLLHKTKGDKRLVLDFYKLDVLVCVITDNGIGMKASKELNKANILKPNSFSTTAIQDRLKLLKDFYTIDVGVSYKELEEGTRVIIKIPYKV